MELEPEVQKIQLQQSKLDFFKFEWDLCSSKINRKKVLKKNRCKKNEIANGIRIILSTSRRNLWEIKIIIA